MLKAEEQGNDTDHLEAFVKYFDQEFAGIKASLTSDLPSGKVTFILAWALFKPNDHIYSSTYDVEEYPRAFKINTITRVSYCITSNPHIY
jgi:hypothetical protein